MSAKVFPLKGQQREAVEPGDNVWLSASAGTGKTQVLSARVLRLLLRPEVKPGSILCLTFTKAGAAEMANRINAVLARWVRLDEAALAKELGYLGAPFGKETIDRARELFASVLDCPGGGLRIDTIHAFAQWLLSSFPEEAGLTPGASVMDDRQKELLARDVLADVLQSGDVRVTDAVEAFVTRKDPDALRSWLMRCAGEEGLWEGPQGWQSPVNARVRGVLGIPADADAQWAAQVLHPDTFPDDQLRAMLPLMRDWSAKTGQATAAFIDQWLSTPTERRADAVEGFLDTVLKKDGEPRKMANPTKAEPRLPDWQQAVAEVVALYQERRALLELAELLTAAFEIGRAFALHWKEAKRREGLMEFDDLIRRAAALLANGEATEWIRYKLDRSFDHVLIDEAQDTNQAQWDIVDALIDDFFAGEGARGDRLRTIFTVGDYKQAIFGFQGTSPENYERAKRRIRQRILDAKENAAGMRDERLIPSWRDLDLDRSFRTSKPVLGVVNQAINALGHEAFGLSTAPPDHDGESRAGMVTMWNPVIGEREEEGATKADEERDWLAHHDTVLAQNIADQVARWVRGPERYVLEKGETRRHAEPGDIMVLVRKRGGLAGQIVAKLHERRVAVAGVDRLRLGQPLAVRDVMAALRFATQPLDDLECANLLASPLIGWSQDELLEFVPRPDKTTLWHHLRREDAPARMRETADILRQLLARADYQTPQALIAWLLSGPWQARRKLVARLGREANDPLDELVNAAFAYESANVPSLAGFIEWFDAGEAELKRDPDGVGGQVRVMTVHGSKGLQAPIVILADATGKPGQGTALELAEDRAGHEQSVPLPALKADERVGPLKIADEAASAADMQEHWRLLYVAMTRAEEALFIGGALGVRDAEKGPHEDSWYARLEPLFGEERLDDPIWGGRRELGEAPAPLVPSDASGAPASAETPTDLPGWLTAPIGPEPRPPRPLAPSGAGEEQGADPPMMAVADTDAQLLAQSLAANQAANRAARRGVLIHRLLERLPDIAPENRAETGATWLARQAGDLDDATRAAMMDQALSVLGTPGFAAIFGPEALAEVPLSATVNGVVIAGTVDRLLVSADGVQVVDFKTTRRPPTTLEQVPSATLRQMAAYTAALEAIYPGRCVSAALLYTQTPQLIELPPETLAMHKQQLDRAQESLGASDPAIY
ncbi:MAG: double-strand break repair helicase AddA [Pseudomonadota bacterium]